jgi:hypothetical protein
MVACTRGSFGGMTDASPALFARPHIVVQERPDGSVLLRAAEPLGEYPPTIVQSRRAWAAAAGC